MRAAAVGLILAGVGCAPAPDATPDAWSQYAACVEGESIDVGQALPDGGCTIANRQLVTLTLRGEPYDVVSLVAPGDSCDYIVSMAASPFVNRVGCGLGDPGNPPSVVGEFNADGLLTMSVEASQPVDWLVYPLPLQSPVTLEAVSAS